MSARASLLCVEVLRWLFWLSVALVGLGGFSGTVGAETCSGGVCTEPATSSGGAVPPVNYSCYSGMPPADKRTNQADAEYWCLQYFVGESNAALWTRDSRESRSYGYMLNWKYTSGAGGVAGVGMTYNCAAGQTKAYVATGDLFCTGGTVYTCPSTGGWTLSGTNCTRPACAAGTSRQADGSCLKDCGVPVDEQVGAGSIYLRPGDGGKVCVEGCSAYIGGRTYTEGGQTYGQAWSYGVSCTGGTEASPTPAGEASPAESACHDRGMCSGTVSGATICVTCDSTSSETKTTKTETPPGAAGPTTTTTTTTTTCVEAGSCSTTTTSTTSGPGGSGTSSETTTKPSGAEPDPGEEKPESKPFCEENPDSPICKVSSFSGTCGAEPACEGDPVQCAQAREAFKLRCALTPNATDDGPITSAKHSDASKDALTEQQQQALDLINGVTPDPSSASRSAWDAAMSSGWFEPITIAGCAPLHMEFAGHSVTWDHCPVAAKISDIGSYALWFGLLVGGFVFLTGGRNAGVS